MTHQPLLVILGHIPEKGSRDIKETVVEIKEMDRRKVGK